MIHIQRQDGKHEWISHEECKKKYPDLYAAIMAPHPDPEPGRDLERMRAEAGVTLREMSARVGLSIGELRDIERGRAKPTLEVFEGYEELSGKQEYSE